MAFRIPNFNLTVNIWHNAFLNPFAANIPAGPPDLVIPAQLALDHTNPLYVGSNWLGFNGTTLRPVLPVLIRMAARTDVRAQGAAELGNPLDVIECPAGTARYYAVIQVDDIGRGFANEYRFAWCFPIFQPVPLT